MKQVKYFYIACIFLLPCSILVAHHGWSEFNQDSTVHLEGTVLSVSFENPHVTISLRVGNETWNVVMAPPRRIRRAGLHEENLNEGAVITIAGHPHRNRDRYTRIFELVLGDETYIVR